MMRLWGGLLGAPDDSGADNLVADFIQRYANAPFPSAPGPLQRSWHGTGRAIDFPPARKPEPERTQVVRHGTALGWRRWQVQGGEHARLVSGNGDVAWKRGVTNARCRPRDGMYGALASLFGSVPRSSSLHGDNNVPAEDCTCGLYAWADLNYTIENDRYGPILGLVEGWGKVIHHEHGWRAQHARPVALIASGLSETLGRRLAAYYDCELIVCPPWDDAIIAATRHLQPAPITRKEAQ